jgi:DNA-binding LacI/PurR family transcriptional regulator
VTDKDMKVLEVNWLLQELAGRRVPDDVSLMGFESPGISEFQRPSLTTIASPLGEMTEKAVEIVLRDGFGSREKIELRAQLIERRSVRSMS